MNWNEYIFGGPYKSRERAEESMIESFAEGEIDRTQSPRVVALRNHRNKIQSYALVLTDTSM